MRSRRITVAAFLAIFFIFFHARATGAYFADDEMMNIFGYWNPPVWKVALANIAFWSKFIRPMGALYYLPLYEMFGLNPIPYNVVRLLFLAVNTVLFYILAKRIARSWWIAALATLPVSYHAGMSFLAYRGSFIYDILCAGFYFAALLWYLRCRKTGARLGVPQTCLFLVLYICSLNSKEMAVSLPVIVLAYELLFHASRPRLIPVAIAIAITAVFIAGKTIGQGTLTEVTEYQPVFTWARFAESNTRFLNTIFYSDLFAIGHVLALWAAILVVAAGKLRRDPRWMFWSVWVLVTPLPIAFLPNRGGAMLYVPVAGWAMLTAMTLRALAHRVSRRIAMPILLGIFAVLYAYETWSLDGDVVAATLASGGKLTRLVGQLNGLGFRPAPRSRIVFLNDPFPGSYTTQFAAYLFWNDHSLDIILQTEMHFPPEVIAARDYIFDLWTTAWSRGSPVYRDSVMRVLIFGATGMVGQGVLRECLLDPEIDAVQTVGRTATGIRNAKLREIVPPDMFDYAAVESEMRGFDACFFCLGVSSVGMPEAQYEKLTYTLTLAAAETLSRLNPQMTFVYVSGAGTDSTEKGSSAWARVKGRTENAIQRLPFKAAYMFRPGVIQPMHGERAKVTAIRVGYALTKPLFPLLRRLFPRYMLTTEDMGKAMINVARRGAPKPILEISDILNCARIIGS